MLIVIVFESLLGNTRTVAEAIAAGIADASPEADVSCGTAEEVGSEAATADLLVVGTPTHFFGLPSSRSRHLWAHGSQRADAGAAPGAALSPGAERPGVREWLDGLSAAQHGSSAAAFDTRLRRAGSGAAARRIARRLRRLGYRMAAPPAGFYVDDMTGPLGHGELERARAWGAGLGAQRVPWTDPGTGPARTRKPVDRTGSPPRAQSMGVTGGEGQTHAQHPRGADS